MLIDQQTYDNVDWINMKVNEFQTRLNSSRRAIRARAPPDSKDSGAYSDVKVVSQDLGNDDDRKGNSNEAQHFSTSAPIKGVNSHRWLDTSSKFAEEMSSFWRSTVTDFLTSRQNQGTPERVEEDVVIALIDDGVDMFDKALSNQVLEGKSFDYHDGKVRPPFSSARGHGTVMASMILDVCPMAKVYPIRLKTQGNRDGKNNIDADYAAQVHNPVSL